MAIAVSAIALIGAAVGAASFTGRPAAAAGKPAPSLDEYRHFRALTIDLKGRMPTRDEVAAFERGLDLDRWIDAQLDAGAHVERLSRTYMDLLRLEVAPSFLYLPWASMLRRVKILGPDNKETWVYFRRWQRRSRPETDSEFCLTERETGLRVKMDNQVAPEGTAVPVDSKVLEARTVLVKPWWLYGDERAQSPSKLLGEGWSPGGGYEPIPGLTTEPDGSRTRLVRVCREEAQSGETGTIFVAGRDAPVPADKLGRLGPALADTPYAKEHKGEAVSCRSAAGVALAPDCGCGAGLWACLPGDSNMKDPIGFALPARAPLGMDQPFEKGPQAYSQWHKAWWNEEAKQLFNHLIFEDRDFREVLSGRWTWVNGPLAQFYRATAPSAAGGPAKLFAVMGATEPLVNPAGVPADLSPHDFDVWRRVDDRGPRAAGIATTPAFLIKYASRRARAATLYTAFLCKAFTTDTTPLVPSTDPDLRRRAGCATCHATLEPLAAYFGRVQEADFAVLSQAAYPVDNPKCRPDAQGKIHRLCGFNYDPAFTDAGQALLRGAYGAPAHVDVGPPGAAAEIAGSPDFAACAVSRAASAFLGRPLTVEDAALAKALEATFVEGGYRMKPLVRAVLRSEAYARSTVWSSSFLRDAAPRGPQSPDTHPSPRDLQSPDTHPSPLTDTPQSPRDRADGGGP